MNTLNLLALAATSSAQNALPVAPDNLTLIKQFKESLSTLSKQTAEQAEKLSAETNPGVKLEAAQTFSESLEKVQEALEEAVKEAESWSESEDDETEDGEQNVHMGKLDKTLNLLDNVTDRYYNLYDELILREVEPEKLTVMEDNFYAVRNKLEDGIFGLIEDF